MYLTRSEKIVTVLSFIPVVSTLVGIVKAVNYSKKMKEHEVKVNGVFQSTISLKSAEAKCERNLMIVSIIETIPIINIIAAIVEQRLLSNLAKIREAVQKVPLIIETEKKEVASPLIIETEKKEVASPLIIETEEVTVVKTWKEIQTEEVAIESVQNQKAELLKTISEGKKTENEIIKDLTAYLSHPGKQDYFATCEAVLFVLTSKFNENAGRLLEFVGIDLNKVIELEKDIKKLVDFSNSIISTMKDYQPHENSDEKQNFISHSSDLMKIMANLVSLMFEIVSQMLLHNQKIDDIRKYNIPNTKPSLEKSIEKREALVKELRLILEELQKLKSDLITQR